MSAPVIEYTRYQSRPFVADGSDPGPLQGPEATPPLKTYAVIDASKVFALPEKLTGGTDPHCCLYKDAAALGEAAPWLVELTLKGQLAANLITHSDPPMRWELLQYEAAIFFQSAADLASLRAHLRRYTSVPDEGGAQFLLRFYDPVFLSALIEAMTPEEKAGFLAPIARLSAIVTTYDGAWIYHQFEPTEALAETASAPLVFDREKRHQLRNIGFRRRAWAISKGAGHDAKTARDFERHCVRMMACDYHDDTRLLELFALYRQLPGAAQPDFLKTARSGAFSPRALGLHFCKQHGLTYPEGASQ
ncbi:DUF4123 domain-containing protein [Alphaproteobacteria bacterium KMM 3653]|uniref:DUF4123 domain-containing protein n=1 Tax=Harenicola maris TaxID=2841044 RepID=A0AAP2G8A5_9RHOB|nr:DUF4123 domain-containing protein [Harenicola maris]